MHWQSDISSQATINSPAVQQLQEMLQRGMRSSIVIFILAAFTASTVQGFLPVEEALQQALSDFWKSSDDVINEESTPSNSSVAMQSILDELKMSGDDSASAQLCTHSAGPYGGGGGGSFNELPDLCRAAVSKIVIYAGRYVDSIQVTYKYHNGAVHTLSKHGGGGGGKNTIDINVAAGERIVGAFGKTGSLVDNLGFITNHGRVFGPYGGGGGGPFTVNKCLLRGIIGRSGSLIDSIGFHCSQPASCSKV